MFNSELIGTEHLLLSILKDDENVVTKYFQKNGVDYDMVREELKNILKKKQARNQIDPKDDISGDSAEEEGEDLQRGYGNITRKSAESKSRTRSGPKNPKPPYWTISAAI